ncbi:unnamed protein product [Rhizopus stolonifer]
MEEHQRDTGCMRAFVARQLAQSSPSLGSINLLQEQTSNVEADQLSDMSVSARSDLTHISDMGISVGGETPSIHSESMESVDTLDEDHGGLLVSPDTVDRRIRSSDDGFKVVLNIDVCPNGCYLFPSNDKNILTCTVSTCNRPRYNQHEEAMAAHRAGLDLNAGTALSLSPIQHLSVVSVGAALAQLLVNDDKLHLFSYRRSLEPFNEH